MRKKIIDFNELSITDGSFFVYAKKNIDNSFTTSKIATQNLLQYIQSNISAEAQIIELTRAQLLTLKKTDELSENSLYFITDKNIFLHTKNDILSEIGIRIQRTVKFEYYEALAPDKLGMFDVTLTPNVGDFVIWGNKVWENVNGNIGSSIDNTKLDTEWAEMTDDLYYNYELYECGYNLDGDIIFYQKDNRNNILYTSDETILNLTDWGNIQYYNNTITDGGIYNNLCQNINNNNIVFGGIESNSAEHIIQNVVNGGGITFNVCSGYIDNNICNVGISTNTGVNINNNKCNSITNNIIKTNIYDNTISGNIVDNATSTIYGNLISNGDIAANVVTLGIYNNINSGGIDVNTCNGISFNYNIGYIRNNNIGANDIINNSNSGNINSNTNIGHISQNKNNGDISNNAGNISIYQNYNNGNIDSNVTAGTFSIYNNINNGDISIDPIIADVTDTIVDKT